MLDIEAQIHPHLPNSLLLVDFFFAKCLQKSAVKLLIASTSFLSILLSLFASRQRPSECEEKRLACGSGIHRNEGVCVGADVCVSVITWPQLQIKQYVARLTSHKQNVFEILTKGMIVGNCGVLQQANDAPACCSVPQS